MIATGFKESNAIQGPPKGCTEEQVASLNVYSGPLQNGQPCVISCFKITADELDEFKLTGRIFLIVPGKSMPPVVLTATSPFGS